MPCSGCGGGVSSSVTSAEVADGETGAARFTVTVAGEVHTFSRYRAALDYQQDNGGHLGVAK